MHRLVPAVLCLASFWTGVAAAQPAPFPPMAADSVIVIHNADIPRLVVFAWERDGKFINARPGDGVVVPYDAARNEVKLMQFPSGSVRELLFTKGGRTHPHLNRENIFTYTVAGRRTQFANEQSFQVEPGDASFQPAGINHHAETLRTGINIEIALPAPLDPDAQATWITGRTPALLPVAEWVRDGNLVRVRGDAAASAPAEAVRYTAKLFEFRPNPLEEIHLDKGVKTPTGTRDGELIGYVVKGRMKVTVGGNSDVAVQGDAIRVAAGRPFSREALEDTVLVETLAPRTPGGIAAR